MKQIKLEPVQLFSVLGKIKDDVPSTLPPFWWRDVNTQLTWLPLHLLTLLKPNAFQVTFIYGTYVCDQQINIVNIRDTLHLIKVPFDFAEPELTGNSDKAALLSDHSKWNRHQMRNR